MTPEPLPLHVEAAIDDVFSYHAPGPDDPAKYEAIRAAAREVARVVYVHCPCGDDRAAAIKALREAVMFANASIALHGRGL